MYSGNLAKMVVSNTKPISYSLVIGEQLVPLNPLIGKKITLTFDGRINCIACSREIKKSFQQGYCFPCTRHLAQCDLCILKPSLCHYHNNTCREPEWGDKYCMRPHIVYISNTSGLKVGITRKTQVPTRWIDQGAVSAIPVFETATRYISGLIEAEITKIMSDRTNWRNMLKNKVEEINLFEEKQKIIHSASSFLEKINAEFGSGSVQIAEEPVTTLDYPVLSYPLTVKTLSFDKESRIEGIVVGIKGQYLILDSGVINIRKFSGYWVNCS